MGAGRKAPLAKENLSQLVSQKFTIVYGENFSHEASTEASSPESSFRLCYDSSAHPDDSLHRPASVTRSNQTIHLTVLEVIPTAVLQKIICRHETGKVLQKKPGNSEMVMEGSLPGSNRQCWISGLHYLPATDAFGAARG